MRTSNVDALTYGWFDHFLKGEDNHVLETMPKVRYYVMGENRWETVEHVAAGRRAAAELLSVERWQSEQLVRGWLVVHSSAEAGCRRPVHLRSDESCDDAWRQCLLRRQRGASGRI